VTLSGFADALREDKGTRKKDKGNPIKRGLGTSAFRLEPLSFSLCLVPHFSHESLMENGVYQKLEIPHDMRWITRHRKDYVSHADPGR
jgi:hypothetical protein